MGITSREFNQDAACAKKAALHGPVFITDRGRPAHVLLSIKEHQRLIAKGQTLWDIFADKDDGGGFDFDPPKLNIGFRPAEFDKE